MSRLEGSLHGLKADTSARADDEDCRHGIMLLVGPALLSVMCVVAGHTARWAGSFERIPKALAVACGASDGRHYDPEAIQTHLRPALSSTQRDSSSWMVQRLARKRAHEANKAAAKDLQEAMEAVSTAERSGPDCGGDGELSEGFIELIKRLGDVGRQFRLGLAAIDESRLSTKH